MDYAIEVLKEKLTAVKWALNKWKDADIEEFKTGYNKVKEREKELEKAIHILLTDNPKDND